MKTRFQTLDGWRGISILLVLAGHLLPLGPHDLLVNETVAATGMVLFFILSGFLIFNILINDQDVINFLIRRFMRIIPLAWLTLLVILFLGSATEYQWISNMLFFANLPPFGLLDAGGHFWSLCVEVQFYILISLLLLFFRKWALYAIPVISALITVYRVIGGVHISILTQFRLDEILAGCTLALIFHKTDRVKALIGLINPIYLMPILLFSAHPVSGPLNYMRPYLAMLLIGTTLFAKKESFTICVLRSKFLAYMASVSYAVYIFHGVFSATWLGSGEKIIKYLKRPLLLAVTFGLAHVSTNYYERYWIGLGRKIISSRRSNNSL